MTAREFFAEEIEAVCGLKTPGLAGAFAAVPRERFLGDGPWVVRSESDFMGPARTTPDADPRRVYHNMSVAIDPARQLFNGAPGFLATLFDALQLRPGSRVLHVGCGTGYYSAILGQVVGSSGVVHAIEIDDTLAARATSAVAEWPWVRIETGDGRQHPMELDAVVVNAGTTHPLLSWLDALAPGGRMVLPLTMALLPGAPIGKGIVVLVTRTEAGFDARLVTMVAIYNAIGLRDPALEQPLAAAMRRGDFMTIKHLRVDRHEESADCWLHTPGLCWSRA